jgi:hypothetical protein
VGEIEPDPLASTQPAPRSSRSRLERLFVRGFLVFAVLAVLATLTVWALLAWGHHRLEEQLEAIRARGEPAFPEEIVWPIRAPGDDPATWLRALRDAESDHFSAADLPSCAALGGIADEVDWSEFHATLADPLRVESLDACEREFLDRDLDSKRASLELAIQVECYARLARRPAFSNTIEGLVEGLFLGVDVAMGVVKAARVLSHATLAAALAGDIDGTVEHARLAMRAASLLDDSSNVRCSGVSIAAKRMVLTEGILPALHLLPAGSDLTAIEWEVEAPAPRALLHANFLRERAVVNRLYDLLRDDANALDAIDLASSFRARVARALLDHDQADYLEEVALALRAMERPFWDPAWRDMDYGAMDERHPHRYYNILSRMMLRPAEPYGESMAKLEVRCLLTRAVIRARRDGAQAAGDWIGTQTDPFTGGPLRWRLDADGLMVLWSAGTNRIDDGGTTGDGDWPPLDEVVRVRPR